MQQSVTITNEPLRKQLHTLKIVYYILANDNM